MIHTTQDIQPLTTFRNHSAEFMQQLKATQRLILLTVNGKPEAVLEARRRHPAPPRPLRQSRRPRRHPPGPRRCRCRPHPPRPEVFAELRKKHNLPR